MKQKYATFIRLERQQRFDFEAENDQEAINIASACLGKLLEKHGFVLRLPGKVYGHKITIACEGNGRQDAQVYRDHGNSLDLVSMRFSTNKESEA